MKVLIAPDSYKGCLSSGEVCQCIKHGLLKANDSIDITCVPLADGGEGFGDCLGSIMNAKCITARCTDVFGDEITGNYYRYGNTAIIECAAASALQKNRLDVMESTSYGTGQLIFDAYNNKCSKIILGLGGSGCNDGGCGALSALGAKIYSGNNIIKIPHSKDLNRITKIDTGKVPDNITMTYACDVENPFCGKSGAAYIFARQKGASDEQIEILDSGLKNILPLLPQDISGVKSCGAAGGLCGGLFSVLGGDILSGFDILSSAAKLEEKIINCDYVITGEGKTDLQTLMGKLPKKIADLAAKHGKKCIVISGTSDGTVIGDKTITLTDSTKTAEYCITHAKEILKIKSQIILH